MPSLYGDNLEAVVSGGEQVTADLGEALYLVTQGLAGKAPRINTGGVWEVFDNSTQTWVATGVYAHGQDAYSPYVSDSGYWYVWDDQNQEYVNTNVKARGPEGPLAELDASYDETTKTLTLGTKTVSYVRLWIDVETGELVVGSTSWNYLRFALNDDGYLEVEL